MSGNGQHGVVFSLRVLNSTIGNSCRGSQSLPPRQPCTLSLTTFANYKQNHRIYTVFCSNF
ncbi:hypothetical protein E2C01_067285 [Portunus trituberculatus]|uniref:Uncharacterized protein n=1 Tax=Portunus trituberculatus TaxID=210409 RepID=A0A5B7HT70_PORTR|nr:hypothetical protein [Portunus trituberculatus]